MLENLKSKIQKKAVIISEEILSVDSFLNHQLDIALCHEIGKTLAKELESTNPTMILTAESSGIVPAFTTASILNIPMIVVRKAPSKIMQEDYISISSFSFTRKSDINLYLNKKYVNSQDRVLIIDDFLSNGDLSNSLVKLVDSLNARVVGAGFVIEKSYLPGRSILEQYGFKIVSLARISSLANNQVHFLEPDC